MQRPQRLTFIITLISLRLLLTFLGLAATIFAIFLNTSNYENFTNLVLTYAGREDMRAYWSAQLLPISRFFYLQIFATTISIAYIFAYIYTFKKHKSWAEKVMGIMRGVGRFLRGVWQNTAQNFGNLPKKMRYLFAIIFVAFLFRTAFNAHFYELQYDEAWTYNNFVHRGAIISAISPHNNHILYTILASWLNFFSNILPNIFSIDGKFILRLPVMLGGAFFLLLWLAFWLRQLGGYKAILQSAWLISAPVFMFYAMYGRGYIFAILFGFIHLWALVGIAESINNSNSKPTKKHTWTLAAARILGVYSLPTYIYIWLAAELAFICVLTKKQGFAAVLKPLLQNLFLVILFLALLYAPFLLTNGISVLWSAAAKSDYTFAQHWQLFHKLSDWLLWGADTLYSGFFTLFLVAFAVWQLRKENRILFRIWHFFSIFILLLPLFAFFYQPLRVWSPQILAYGFLFGQILIQFYTFASNYLQKNISKNIYLNISKNIYKNIFTLCIFFCILCNQWQAYRHYEINWTADLDRTAKNIAQILANNQINELYIFSRYDKPLLEYYHLRRTNQPLKVAMPFVESVDYQLFTAKIYPAILLDIEDYRPTATDKIQLAKAEYELIYSNWRLQLYIAKK